MAATWVGGDEPSIHFDYMSQGQGAVMALPIYARFLKKMDADKSLNFPGTFEKPIDYAEPENCDTEIDSTFEFR